MTLTEIIEKFENTSPCCPNCGNNCKHECEFFTSIFAVEDVAPVVHAKWEERFSLEYKTIVYDCSNCGATHSYISNYCPNCGAKMDIDRE